MDRGWLQSGVLPLTPPFLLLKVAELLEDCETAVISSHKMLMCVLGCGHMSIVLHLCREVDSCL